MRAMRRLFAVGALATALDVALVVVLSQLAGFAPGLADLVAIVVAVVVSYVGHRLFTFSADPARRWYDTHLHYLAATTLALAVDVGLLVLITGAAETVGTLHLVGAKVVSLGGAFTVRSWFYRRAMFSAVRKDQLAPVERPAAPGDLRLSVVIPAYREEDRIAETVDRVRAELTPEVGEGQLEIVVVDDGSGDGTSERARLAGADQVVTLEQNSGKGAAVRAGVMVTTGRTVAFTDADLAYAPAQMARLMTLVEDGWDVAVGSRKHTETSTLVKARRVREVGGRIVNVLTSIVLLGQYRDTQCGLKAFRSDVARLIFERSRVDGFAFDVEVFHLVERYRLTLAEVPVEVVNSTRSTVHVVRDAVRLVRDLFGVRAAGRAGKYEISVADLPAALRRDDDGR